MSLSSNIYTPGSTLNLTAGITSQEWVQNKCPVPVEDGFISDPGASVDAVIAANLSGSGLQVTMTTARALPGGQVPELYNEKVLNSVYVPHGTSTHFPSNPMQFIVSFDTCEVGVMGKNFVISGQGQKLSNLANRRITIREGPVPGSALMLAVGPEEHFGGRFELDNRSSQRIYMSIVSESTAYKLTEAQLSAERSSRSPDRGGKLIDRMSVASRAKEWFKPPVISYYIRATDPRAARNNSYLISSLNTNNYVELAATKATSGQVVVFTADRTGNGAVDVQTKNSTDVKFICSDIVRTL